MNNASHERERVQRLQALAWLMDSSIRLPGGYRIGLDALMGLIPGVGDVCGALISAYIVNEARSLGVPRSVLVRMMGNILLETALGAIPVAGDVFDAAFKANVRNLRLLERYRLDPIASRRSSSWLVAGFGLLLALFVATLIAIPAAVIVWLLA